MSASLPTAPERYYDYDTDRMRSDWRFLIAPPEVVDSPPAPALETVIPPAPKRVDISQFMIPDEDCRLCAYCEKPFTPKRIGQKYHDPAHERLKQYQRKESLIIDLACWLEAHGLIARDMLAVARKMVEVEYERVMVAMRRLGYKYSEARREWRIASCR